MHTPPTLVVTSSAEHPVPPWAEMQAALRAEIRAAIPEFVARYTRSDGTLIWRESWPGMDGSDDPYEAFMYLALFYALDGDEVTLALSRRMWNSITWQWTQYGQISREFDRYYDWMHHGEGSLYTYFLGLGRPESVVDRQRAESFAQMYTGNDPLAPNYDKNLRLIRAPHTGSDGPRFSVTSEDFSTHREVLSDYAPPFEDMRTVPPDATECDWTNDEVFAEAIRLMNDRTMRGDIPLNLNATGLVVNAFMYSGDPSLRDWVEGYVDVWSARARQNHGIVPDNVGLDGRVGQYLDGRWWGGHYGWRWPHGLLTIVEPVLNGCTNAFFVSGDVRHLAMIRGLLDSVHKLGKDVDGRLHIPNRHGDSGWYDYRPPSANVPIHLWALTVTSEDRERALQVVAEAPDAEVRVPTVPFASKHYNVNTVPWFQFVLGQRPNYPEAALAANADLLRQQLARMRSAEGDPNSWANMERLSAQNGSGPSLQNPGYAIHVWQEFCPVYFESLVHLMWGAPMHVSHGGFQFASVRYFDPHRQAPGLPQDVAALVSRIDEDGISLTLVNLNRNQARTVQVQAGAFREHRFESADLESPLGVVHYIIAGPEFNVQLAGGAQADLRLKISRHAFEPTYSSSVSDREDWPSTIMGRNP